MITEPQMQGICGTDRTAPAASNTFSGIRCFHRVNVHRADAGTLPTGDALVLIAGEVQKADLVEDRIDGAERAQGLAEKAFDQDASDEHDCQDPRFKGKQLSQRTAQLRVCQKQRNPGFQRTREADVTAEEVDSSLFSVDVVI